MGEQDSSGITFHEKVAFIQRSLLKWYEKHGRKHLPWRAENVPKFHRLVAEILLQKTRAENVIEVYRRFVEVYPDPVSLAKADENELAEFLRPLGLYRNRSKNLIKLAKAISNKVEIPCNRDDLEQLPGVGPYIANAFLLSACNERVPVVDTNIRRLLKRVFSVEVGRDPRRDPSAWRFVERILPEENYREFTWALLDLAALICKSRKPSCHECPISLVCDYYRLKV